MGRITQRMRILRLTTSADGATEQVQIRGKNDAVAAEEPLELRLGGESFTVTMRTPGHDFELVAGFLLAEGIIRSPQQLISQRYCAGTDENGNQTYNVIDAALDAAAAGAVLAQRRQVTTTSACGICGTTSIDAVEKTLPFPAADPQLSLDIATLLELPEQMRSQQRVFESTGGVHAAGLFDSQGELLCLREDVGRHNAVDKVIGWAFLANRLPLRGTVLQVSGRASFELVQKAAMAGIEALSAVGSPSSLAVDLAQRTGVTLAGFSRGRSINIYTHSYRLRGINEDADAPAAEKTPEAPATGTAGKSQVITHV